MTYRQIEDLLDMAENARCLVCDEVRVRYDPGALFVCDDCYESIVEITDDNREPSRLATSLENRDLAAVHRRDAQHAADRAGDG